MANIVCKLIEVPGGKEVELEDLTADGREHGRFMARQLIAELDQLDEDDPENGEPD